MKGGFIVSCFPFTMTESCNSECSWRINNQSTSGWSLSMTEVRIPKHIMRYEDAVLGCKYDLDGESLYSVKWYKDGFEFYRYVPRDMPPGQVFPLPGVDVDLQNSTDNVVVLHRVTLQSTGRYRCEVSGEAPSFQTVSGHEDMIVVVTPTKGPQITGGQPRYQIGDMVRVNCTSAPSKPICHLSWLINGIHANRSFLRYYEPKLVGREGLEVATLGLEFRCVAKISSVYWQSNEESVESDKHQRIPVLESRETVVPKSRLLDKSLDENQKKSSTTTTSAAQTSFKEEDFRFIFVITVLVRFLHILNKLFTNIMAVTTISTIS
uniref:Ig-like domain-containing protein n=1 Tax=Glossina palpalis gambiensis TaxID=67801 RepID=A0A1B0AWA8_9MUSC